MKAPHHAGTAAWCSVAGPAKQVGCCHEIHSSCVLVSAVQCRTALVTKMLIFFVQIAEHHSSVTKHYSGVEHLRRAGAGKPHKPAHSSLQELLYNLALHTCLYQL